MLYGCHNLFARSRNTANSIVNLILDKSLMTFKKQQYVHGSTCNKKIVSGIAMVMSTYVATNVRCSQLIIPKLRDTPRLIIN
jgi:hypothetical protein